MQFRGIWLLITSVLLLPRSCTGKYQKSNIKIGSYKPAAESRWKYLTKFTFGLGQASYRLRIQPFKKHRLTSDVNLVVELYLDENWTLVQDTEEPCDRRQHSRRQTDVTLLKSGEWSSWVTGKISQTVRPHVWFFYLADCEGLLPNRTLNVRFEFTATQENGSHLSVEHSWMPLANVLALLQSTAFAAHVVKQCRAFQRNCGSLHPVIWALVAIISAYYLAQLFQTIHWWSYRSNGQGLFAFDILGEMLSIVGQMTETSLLILIAMGYTLLQSKLGELDILIPLVMMVAVFHFILVLVAKLDNDKAEKYHDHDGFVGWGLFSLRLLLYFLFLWSARGTAKEGGMRMEHFMMQFTVAGSLYFLAYPLLFLVCPLFAPYIRQPVMVTGLLLMQVASTTYLSRLFLGRGTYFKVSTLSSSFLPGGVRVGVDKDE